MKAFKFLKNSAGVSMVEVMMAVSVMGGLSLTVAQLMKNTSESTKQNEAKQENVNLKGLLQDNLNNTTACVNTFGAIMTPANVTALSGSPTASVTIPNVKDKINAIKYSTTSTNIQPLTITSMSLTNYNATAFTGDFLVNATFKKSTNNIVMVKPIRIPINFSFSGTTLTACSTMAVGGEWMLGGNAGTVDGTDYVGTSDIAPLNFRVNAQKAGRIDSVGQVYLGYQSGNSLTTGTHNTGLGFSALFNNTTGTHNTAVGRFALRSLVSGSHNIGLGSSALYGITTGSNNIGIGQNTLNFIADGSDNIGIGQFALNGNVGPAVTPGGNENVAVGSRALVNNNGGSYNAALGHFAGAYNSSGQYNTFLGFQSGPWAANLSGSNNLFIGARAGNTVPAAATSSNKLYIETTNNSTPLIGGDFSARTVSLSGTTTINLPAWSTSLKLPNRGRITTTTAGATDAIYIDTRTLFRGGAMGGNGFIGVAGGLGIGPASYWDGTVVPAEGDVQIAGTVGIGTQTPAYKLDVVGDIRATATMRATAFTVTSDLRFKENLKSVNNSLERLLKLNAYNYYWKDKEKFGNKKQLGLVAQEVQKVFPETVQKDKEGILAVSYSSLIAPIIEAVKELYSKILALTSSYEKQNIEVEKLKVESQKLNTENEKLKADLKNQAERFDQRMKKLEAEVAKQKKAI